MAENRSSHDACAHEKKPDLGSVQPERSGKGSDSLLREQKKLYGTFYQVACVLEASVKLCAKATRVKGDRRHFEQRIRHSASFNERDRILRDLAAFCYGEGKKCAGLGDVETQMKWLKLLERFLRLSQKLMEDVKFEEELAELEAKMEATKKAGDPGAGSSSMRL
jgi:hypothetical protein